MNSIWKVKTKLILLISLLAVVLAPLGSLQAATPEEIKAAIDKGVPWLAAQQQQDGSWPGSSYGIPTTGLAVLKLEDYAVEQGFNNPLDPGYQFSANVRNGLNFIFQRAIIENDYIRWQIQWGGEWTYVTSIMIMAIISSNNPNGVVDVVNPDSAGINGMTYKQVVEGALNFLITHQSPTDGGWIYTTPDGGSDQSNTGFAGLGLGYVSKFGLTVPQATRDGLKSWNTLIQCMDENSPNYGSAAYTAYSICNNWNNIYKNGHLLYNQALVGSGITTPEGAAALLFVERKWNVTDGTGWKMPEGAVDILATYTMMKGLVGQNLQRIIVEGSELDWFDEVSTVLIANQQTEGYWNATLWLDSSSIATALALLTLEKAIVKPQVSMWIDIKPAVCPNIIRRGASGPLYVALCGTKDFNPKDIDPKSLKIGREGVEATVKGVVTGYRDMATPYNGEGECWSKRADGHRDLIVAFDAARVMKKLQLGQEMGGAPLPLIVTGTLKESKGGTPVTGQDNVRIRR
jgi:hypothetical protein